MKHSVQLFLAIQCCIAINRSVAMELKTPKKQSKNITEITCIKNLQYAQYLYNGNIAITGEDGCSIVDTKTNTEIKKISTIKNQHIAIHPNQKLFALTYENQIDIYDTEKKDYIWKKTVEGSYKHSPNPHDNIEQICFNPHDTTIFVIRANFKSYEESYHDKYKPIPMDYRITEYNYTTHQDGINNSNYGYNGPTPLIALSPTQKKICITHPGWTTLHPTDSAFSGQNRRVHGPYGKYYKEFCQYSPDGSYIVQGDCQNSLYIINSQDPALYEWFKHTCICMDQHRYEDFKNVQFYSNSVLAIASLLRIYDHPLELHPTESHTIFFYWDIHTKKPIHVSYPLDLSTTFDFSFSPCKTKVIIALHDTCVILPVPFKVMYKDITEEKFLYLLFALKNMDLESDTVQLLPDVNLLIAQKFLEICKRD